MDGRLGVFSQLWQNMWNYVANMPMKQQWIDFNNVTQVGFGNTISSLSEGNVDLTNYRKSKFMDSLKTYNRYYKHDIVTFYTGKKMHGWAYFGEFPINLL